MSSNVLWLLRFARPATARLAASTASRVIGHLCGAALLALPAWAIGRIAIAQAAGESVSTGFVLGVVLAFLVIALVKAVLRYLEQFLGHLAAFGLMGEMRVWMVDHLIPQAPAVTDGVGAARLHTVAVRDVDRVEVFFAHTIAPAVSAVLIPLAAILTGTIAAGPAVGAVLALVMAIGVIVPLVGGRLGMSTAKELSAVRGDIAQHIADSARLREDLAALGAEQERRADTAALSDRLSGVLARIGLRTGARHAASQLRIWLGAAAVLAVGLLGMTSRADGIEALPGVLLAAALVPGTVTSLETIERLATSLPAGLEATRRIRELAAGDPVVDEPPQPALPDPEAADRLVLDGVTFAYPGRDQQVLRDVALTVPRGSLIGVVGATGSGKSTIARLAQRHFDPVGAVRLDGIDAPALGSTTVHSRVAIADQEPFLLEGTVAENLRLADPEADDEVLAWALRTAACELAQDRAIGRRGGALSGGQRQRLALARTLVRARSGLEPERQAAPTGRPQTAPEQVTDQAAEQDLRQEPGIGSLLILDEATSHQDPVTQARIVSSVRALGATVVVIAHRLDVLREADTIVVLENGSVVESGRYEELANAGGAFAALLANQET